VLGGRDREGSRSRREATGAASERVAAHATAGGEMPEAQAAPYPSLIH